MQPCLPEQDTCSRAWPTWEASSLSQMVSLEINTNGLWQNSSCSAACSVLELLLSVCLSACLVCRHDLLR